MSQAQFNQWTVLISVLGALIAGIIIYAFMYLLYQDDEFIAYEFSSSQMEEQSQLSRAVSTGSSNTVLTADLNRNAILPSPLPEGDPNKQIYQANVLDAAAAVPLRTDSASEKSARALRETLGISAKKPFVAAVDVELLVSENCPIEQDQATTVSINYRFESPTIRTSSLDELRSLVSQFRRCENSEFHMTSITPSVVENTFQLAQMRYNELKYFFTQSSVPNSALHYSKLND